MPFAQLAELARGILDPSYISDYFYLYCNTGRTDKVVLALSDSLYKKRACSVGAPKTMARLGFRAFISRLGLGGGGPSVDPDLIFMRNQGVTPDPSAPLKFELSLDQFCDAIQMAAECRFPLLAPDYAARAMLSQHLRPAAEVDFPGFATDGSAPESSRSGARAPSRVVLTPRGSAVAGPAAGLSAPIDSLSQRRASAGRSSSESEWAARRHPRGNSPLSCAAPSRSAGPRDTALQQQWTASLHAATSPRVHRSSRVQSQPPPPPQFERHTQPLAPGSPPRPAAGSPGSSPQPSVSALKGALQSLSAVVERQQARIAELEAENARLRASEGAWTGHGRTQTATAAAVAY